MRVRQIEYARMRGVTKKTVTFWKQRGQIAMTADGLVLVERSNAMLARRPEVYRGGVATQPPANGGNGNGSARAGEPATHARTDGPGTTAHAIKVKETYLARLRQLEYDRKSGAVVEVDAVAAMLASKVGNVRNRMLGLGGVIAPIIAPTQAAWAKQIIDRAVVDILIGLSNPATYASASTSADQPH